MRLEEGFFVVRLTADDANKISAQRVKHKSLLKK